MRLYSEDVGRVTVPHPKKDLPKGTWKSIAKQAFEQEGFIRLL